ncbi:hypothetical protein B0H19DRAFT_1130026 [Mycena capillaripes]|nr:hypothetical protein B0H19DRAFT_1130026 [Mycena capillaripes]
MADGSLSTAQAIITQNYCHIFAMVFVYWDFLLKLDSEVQYMWKCPKTFGAFLFFIIRYIAPASNAPVVVLSFFNLSPLKCSRLNLGHQILLFCTQILVSIVMIQRMYALYNRDRRILWGLSGIATSLAGFIVWLMQNQDSIPLTVVPGCYHDVSRATSLRLAGAWGALFLFDSIIFTLTICNAYWTRKRLGTQAQVDMPIHTLIIRDGAIYFAAIALANLANIVTFIIEGPFIPGSLTIFTTCISITMVCRLMLNIHETADVDTREYNLSVLEDAVDRQPLDVDSSDVVVLQGSSSHEQV